MTPAASARTEQCEDDDGDGERPQRTLIGPFGFIPSGLKVIPRLRLLLSEFGQSLGPSAGVLSGDRVGLLSSDEVLKLSLLPDTTDVEGLELCREGSPEDGRAQDNPGDGPAEQGPSRAASPAQQRRGHDRHGHEKEDRYGHRHRSEGYARDLPEGGYTDQL